MASATQIWSELRGDLRGRIDLVDDPLRAAPLPRHFGRAGRSRGACRPSRVERGHGPPRGGSARAGDVLR